MRKLTTKKLIVITSLSVVLLVLSAIALACFTKKHYNPRYLTESCELKIKDINYSGEVSLDKTYSEDSAKIYLGSDVKDDKTIDFLIENSINAYSLIKNNALLKTDFTVVISDKFVSNYWTDKILGLCGCSKSVHIRIVSRQAEFAFFVRWLRLTHFLFYGGFI